MIYSTNFEDHLRECRASGSFVSRDIDLPIRCLSHVFPLFRSCKIADFISLGEEETFKVIGLADLEEGPPEPESRAYQTCFYYKLKCSACRCSQRNGSESPPPPYEKQPCYDILGDLDRFKQLDGVIALKSPKSNIIVFRKDWGWSTLSALHEQGGYVEAVYLNPECINPSEGYWTAIRRVAGFFAAFEGRYLVNFLRDIDLSMYEVLKLEPLAAFHNDTK